MIKDGSNVKIHYTLTVDGDKVDSSEGNEPLSYVQGQAQIIPGLEKELAGMAAGESKQVEISPEEGYGEVNQELIQTVPRTAFQDPENLQVGGRVRGQSGDTPFIATIKDITDEGITLDLNHPLAGKTLNFDVQIVEVQ